MKTLFISFVFLFLIIATQANDATKWTFTTNGRVIAAPILQGDTLLVGSCDGYFYAIDANTGNEIWKYDSQNEIRTTAVIFNKEIICFESGNTMFGLDLAGNLLWSKVIYDGTLTNEHDQWDVFRSSPTLQDSIAYIGSEEGRVAGVNVKNGEIVFQVQTPQANGTIETPPTIYDGKIYVGDWYGVFSAFDIKTQSLLWQYDTKDDNFYGWVNAIVSKPLIYKDKLFFGGRSCNLYALNPETGEKNWMYHQPGDMWLFGGPVVSEDTFYVGSSYQQVIYAFNSNQPELFWETKVFGLSYGNPVVNDDFVIVGTGSKNGINSGGSICIIDKESSFVVGRYPVPAWVETPLYHDGIIYFGCSDNKVYAIVEQDLLIPYANTILKNKMKMDLGQLENTGSIDTSFYVHNIGGSYDSINCTTSADYATIDPASATIQEGDSIKITVTIDLSGFEASYIPNAFTVIVNSKYNLFPDLEISKAFSFNIIEKQITDVSNIASSNSIGRLFPNPAQNHVSLNYALEKPSHIDARIFTSSGKEVIQLINSIKSEGKHSLNINTSGLESGIYLLTFNIDGTTTTQKLTIKK